MRNLIWRLEVFVLLLGQRADFDSVFVSRALRIGGHGRTSRMRVFCHYFLSCLRSVFTDAV